MTDLRHDDMERELLDYLDGQLPADRADDLRRRLADEPELRRLLAQHEILRAGLHRLAEADPADVDETRQRERIVEAVRRQQRNRQTRRKVFRPALTGLAAAAACVVAVVLAWTVLRPTDDVHSDPETAGPVVAVRLHRADAPGLAPRVQVTMRRLDAQPIPASRTGEGAVVAVVTERLGADPPEMPLPPYLTALPVQELGG